MWRCYQLCRAFFWNHLVQLWPRGRAFELSCCPGGRDIWIFVCARDQKSFPGRGILVIFDLTFFPGGREFDSKFLENVKISPYAPPPPRRLDINRCIIIRATFSDAHVHMVNPRRAPDPALRYSKVLQNSFFYLLLQSVICHRVCMGSLPIVLFLRKCRHLECCLKTIPTMPCLPKIITQNPLRALHASEFNMATLGDEDKSSSASSESRSSSWYLVQVGR